MNITARLEITILPNWHNFLLNHGSHARCTWTARTNRESVKWITRVHSQLLQCWGQNTFPPFPFVAELKTLIWQPRRVGQPVFVNRCVEARPFVSSRLAKGMAVRFIVHRSYRFVARPFDSKSHKGFLPCNTSRLTSTRPFQKSQQTIGWLFNSKAASSERRTFVILLISLIFSPPVPAPGSARRVGNLPLTLFGPLWGKPVVLNWCGFRTHHYHHLFISVLTVQKKILFVSFYPRRRSNCIVKFPQSLTSFTKNYMERLT